MRLLLITLCCAASLAGCTRSPANAASAASIDAALARADRELAAAQALAKPAPRTKA
ncbi:MAG TPA: hypothetical protein VEZ48_05340 [Sphingomonadaceae bacterium]|jgi:hypothetical protein|nr:hypothetical protein [Sphingomonadaceae bacterium]